MNNFFPFRYGNKTVTLDMALEALNYIICFVENHFNCNLGKYKNALSVFKTIQKSAKGIKDHKPSKEFCKQAFDVLEEVINYKTDEKTKKENSERCALCKLIIEKYY